MQLSRGRDLGVLYVLDSIGSDTRAEPFSNICSILLPSQSHPVHAERRFRCRGIQEPCEYVHIGRVISGQHGMWWLSPIYRKPLSIAVHKTK